MTRDNRSLSGVGLAWADLRQWQPAPVEDGVSTFRWLADDLESLQDELDRSRPTGWTGASADAAAASRQRLVLDLETVVAEVTKTRLALAHAADGVTEVAAEVADIERWASAAGLSIAADGTVTDARPVAVTTNPAFTKEFSDAQAARARLVTQCVTLMEGVMRKAVAIDENLASSMSTVLSGALRVTKDVGLKGAEKAGVASWADSNKPPVGGTPQQVAAWWKGLDQPTKTYIINNHPEWIGNLDGVDFGSRDAANWILLPKYQADLKTQRATVIAKLKALGDPPTGTGAKADWGIARAPLIKELDEIDAKIDALNNVHDIITKRPDRHLLGLDITHERAQAIIATGNVDTAGHVAVFTPGLTSTVNGMGGYDRQMEDIGTRASWVLAHNHEDPSVATVTWLGYQAPQISTDSLFSNNTVAAPATAIEGGASLAKFYQGISAARDVPAGVTALGHSYGSTTTAWALHSPGVGVARTGLFGSPGLLATNPDQLNVPQGQVYYESTPTDPVAKTGAFGPPPSLIQGVHVMSTAATTAPAGSQLAGQDLSGIQGHTSYLDANTTSQYNLAALVAGHPELVVPG